MTEIKKEQYGIVEIKSELPPRQLFRVPNGNGVLTLGYPAFGPSCFLTNVKEMQLKYAHPEIRDVISFRAPTTCESIAAAAFHFIQRAKPSMFDPKWFQTGIIIKTSEGVYANVPNQLFNGTEVDEIKLKQLLDGTNPLTVSKHNVFIVPDKGDLRGFGFAEYGAFFQGVQDCETFAESGLARILEHAENAQKLRAIAGTNNYPKGVNVQGFDKVNVPTIQVAGLSSDGLCGGGRLNVCGYAYDVDNGLAFGVLD